MCVGGGWGGVTSATASPRSPSLLFIFIIPHPHTRQGPVCQRKAASKAFLCPSSHLTRWLSCTCLGCKQAAFIHPLGSTRSIHLSSTSAFLPYQLNQTGALRRVGVCKFSIDLLHGKGQSAREGPKKRQKQCATPGTPLQTRRKTSAASETRADPLFLAESCYFCSAPSCKVLGCRILSHKAE